MEVGKLTVQRREGTGKGIARKLRMRGDIPGVCYGVGLEGAMAIAVNPRQLKASLDADKRQNTVIDMTVIEDNGEPRTIVVMVKDFQVHPIRRHLIHVDLIAIDTEKAVEAEVPVEIVGKAKGLILGGKLHIERRDVMVRCKPANIPTKLVMDITELDVGDVLHVSDLVLPDLIEVVTPPHLAIITCEAMEADEPTAEAAAAAPEVAAAPAAADKK